MAEELFRETRRQFERAKNDPSVQTHVDLGPYQLGPSSLLHLELIAPGIEVEGERVSEYFSA
jgi:hypothetical protein